MPSAHIPVCPKHRHFKSGTTATPRAPKIPTVTKPSLIQAPSCDTSGVCCPAVHRASSQCGLEKSTFLPLKTQTKRKTTQTTPGERGRSRPTQPGGSRAAPRSRVLTQSSHSGGTQFLTGFISILIAGEPTAAQPSRSPASSRAGLGAPGRRRGGGIHACPDPRVDAPHGHGGRATGSAPLPRTCRGSAVPGAAGAGGSEAQGAGPSPPRRALGTHPRQVRGGSAGLGAVRCGPVEAPAPSAGRAVQRGGRAPPSPGIGGGSAGRAGATNTGISRAPSPGGGRDVTAAGRRARARGDTRVGRGSPGTGTGIWDMRYGPGSGLVTGTGTGIWDLDRDRSPGLGSGI